MAIVPNYRMVGKWSLLAAWVVGHLGRAYGRNYLLAIHMEVFHYYNKRNSHVPLVHTPTRCKLRANSMVQTPTRCLYMY